jgi:hypothetical protein
MSILIRPFGDAWWPMARAWWGTDGILQLHTDVWFEVER